MLSLMARSPTIVRSRAGRAVAIRPAEAGDEAALAAMLGGLSPATVERRYFALRRLDSDLARREAARLAHGAGGRIVLVAAHEVDGQIVGVAEIVPRPGAPGVAECAVVVADAFQGEGIGRAVAAQMAAAAEEAAITHLWAATHAGNARVRRLIATGGRPYTARFDGPDVTYEVELRPDGAAGA